MLSLKDLAIYVDMDGVIADYDGGIKARGFNIDPAIKNDLNRSGTKNPLKRQMYDAIRGTDYYAKLPILPGAIDLWKGVQEAEPITLTASPKFGATEENHHLNPHWLGAAYHKRHWMEYEFLPMIDAIKYEYPPGVVRMVKNATRIPIPDDRFICTTSAKKWTFMHRKKSPHQILIDDRISNCTDWAGHGGFAILYDGDAEKTLYRLDLYRREYAHLREVFLPGGGGMVAGLENSLGNCDYVLSAYQETQVLAYSHRRLDQA